jgi:hypothetical protein
MVWMHVGAFISNPDRQAIVFTDAPDAWHPDMQVHPLSQSAQFSLQSSHFAAPQLLKQEVE